MSKEIQWDRYPHFTIRHVGSTFYGSCGHAWECAANSIVPCPYCALDSQPNERLAAEQAQTERDYGEQCADTDGLAGATTGTFNRRGEFMPHDDLAEALDQWSLYKDAYEKAISRAEQAERNLETAIKERDALVPWPEDQGRESIVTDSEKAADQMRQDILGGKIDKAGRQVVRDACDKMDAPKAGRDAANDALGRISNKGGFW